MICPNCQADAKITEQNYGSLYTCAACQAAYFINFEGQPEFSESEESASEPPSTPDLQLNDFAVPELVPLVEFNQNEFAVPNESVFGSFDDVAKDISEFGNSETQIAHLNYDLKITGLDSIEILKIFKEAIDDKRFGWETNELMRSIKSGEIHLEKLNPVKAYILSKRLQFMDVEKKWKQNVLS